VNGAGQKHPPSNLLRKFKRWGLRKIATHRFFALRAQNLYVGAPPQEDFFLACPPRFDLRSKSGEDEFFTPFNFLALCV
jgi:hypothetical protein